MATLITPAKPWVAREGRIFMKAPASAINFSSATSLSGAFTTSGVAIQAACKNLTVTPPDTGYDKQDFIGVDTNNFQNALLDEKPVGTATLTGTLIVGNNEIIEDIISGTFASAPAGYSRYQYGSDNTSNGTVAVCVTFMTDDYLDEVSYAFDNAKFTKYGDVRLGSPDTHLEQDFTIICLAKDFRVEFKD